jgi:hypothetical protein
LSSCSENKNVHRRVSKKGTKRREIRCNEGRDEQVPGFDSLQVATK